MIRRQLTLPAGPDRVWEALTDPDEAEVWIGGRIEWEPAEGGAVERRPAEGGPLHFESTSGDVREGVVEAVRPARHLRFRWWPADSSDPGGASEVTYTLEPDSNDECTRLTVQETPVDETWTAFDSLRLQMYAGECRGSLCAVG